MPCILEALSWLAELEGALKPEQSRDFVPLLSPSRTGGMPPHALKLQGGSSAPGSSHVKLGILP